MTNTIAMARLSVIEEVGRTLDGWLKEDQLRLQMKLGLETKRLPDISLEKVQKDSKRAREQLDRLSSVDPSELSHEDTLSLRILENELTIWVEAPEHYWLMSPITPYNSELPAVVDLLGKFNLKDRESVVRYLGLLGQFPGFIRSIQRKLEGQLSRGIAIPKEELQAVIAYVRLHTGENSPLRIAVERTRGLPEDARDHLQEGFSRLIANEIEPAFLELLSLLDGDYSERAPDSVGLAQYPGGAECYHWLIRKWTGLDRSPEEIHETGLAEVERITREIDLLQKKLRAPGSREEFRLSLMSDKRFIPDSPEAIGERYARHLREIEPHIPEFFLTRPKTPYAVKRLPSEQEGTVTFGYYQEPTAADPVGYYMYNASNHSEQSLLGSAEVIYHELVPGHHFEVCCANENDRIPGFRKDRFDGAYAEGWAEYAASLAIEMGAYADECDLVGRRWGELFMAVRLVIDTGMNAMEWSLDRAEDYMKHRTLLGDAQVRSELLRYSCDIPGQSLAYKLGHMKVLELRKIASEALGGSFDIRRFHEAVLSSGSLPLGVLETHIDKFIEDERKTPGTET